MEDDLKYYLNFISKCDLSNKEKERFLRIIVDCDLDKDSSYPEEENTYIINFFNSEGDEVLVIEVNEDYETVDVLEMEDYYEFES